jgi:hypothetical protein
MRWEDPGPLVIPSAPNLQLTQLFIQSFNKYLLNVPVCQNLGHTLGTRQRTGKQDTYLTFWDRF